MVFLFLISRILEQEQSSEFEQLATRCSDALMDHHLNSEYELLIDIMTHDLSLPSNSEIHIASVGMGIQALWMVMYEAVRKKDKNLFKASSRAFRRHVNVARDEGIWWLFSFNNSD